MGLDRLTALLDRMRLRIHAAQPEAANLVALKDAAGAVRLLLSPGSTGAGQGETGQVICAFAVDFGSDDSPLLQAIPDRLSEAVDPGSDIDRLVELLAGEYREGRCGGPAVLARLGEVLVVWILRRQIEAGAAMPGLFGGLAHPRISLALVAMHDAPDRPWRSADLADVAGLSHSHFKQLFVETVGVAPMAYLRRWRMVLARSDLRGGARVDRVARRYGYAAPDAFARAYRREFGSNPGSEART